jgi:hypothetical protein
MRAPSERWRACRGVFLRAFNLQTVLCGRPKFKSRRLPFVVGFGVAGRTDAIPSATKVMIVEGEKKTIDVRAGGS